MDTRDVSGHDGAMTLFEPYPSDRPPTQAALDAALVRTARVRVGWGPAHAPWRGERLVEVEDAAELASLRAALRIVEGPTTSCLCHGGPRLELLDGAGAPIATMNVHPDVKLRTSLWDGDAPLVEPDAVWRWLDRHGVTVPTEGVITDADIENLMA